MTTQLSRPENQLPQVILESSCNQFGDRSYTIHALEAGQYADTGFWFGDKDEAIAQALKEMSRLNSEEIIRRVLACLSDSGIQLSSIADVLAQMAYENHGDIPAVGCLEDARDSLQSAQ